MLLEDAKEKLSQFSPEVRIETLRLLGSGNDSSAFLANGQWVFRFPQTEAAGQFLKKEIALLPQLQGVLPVRIPCFTEVAQNQGQIVYVGYQLLAGAALEKSTFDRLDDAKQKNALQDLASFLHQLHTFPVKSAAGCAVTAELYKGAYTRQQKALIEPYQHLLSEQERAKIAAIFAAFENNAANFSNPEALLHADLKPEHILFDPATGHISGIIDWGDVALGDPDFDFTCLYMGYGKDFIMRLLNYFPDKDRARVVAKIQFFILIRWLQDTALFFKRQDRHFVTFCLAGLRQHIA